MLNLITLPLFLPLFLLELAVASVISSPLPLKDQDFLRILENRDVISRVKAVSNDTTKQQQLSFQVAGLHNKSCPLVLPTLGRYEKYDKYISFIKESHYQNFTRDLYFVLDHPLLPESYILTFKIDRILKPGHYTFFFPIGIFPGLQGIIDVQKVKSKREHEGCLFYIKAYWSGRESIIPNIILELFLETLSTMAIQKLFKISGHSL